MKKLIFLIILIISLHASFAYCGIDSFGPLTAVDPNTEANYLEIKHDAGTLYLTNHEGDWIFRDTSETELIRLTSGGLFSINQASPTATLEVKGAEDQNQLKIWADASQSIANPIIFVVDSSGNELFRIHCDSNVLANTILGNTAGAALNGGARNSYLGQGAGNANVSGNDQTFSGAGSGLLCTSNANTYYGSFAGGYNVSSTNNAGFGYKALYFFTGGYNTAVGDQACSGISNGETGAYNSALGYFAGNQLTDGTCNVTIGCTSGQYLATGSYNTLIGYGTGVSLGAGDDGNVMIGCNAGYNETGSDKLYIDNSNTSNPLIYGDFDSDSVIINGDVDIGTSATGKNLTIVATEGTELVITNPTFDSDLTGWTGGADWTWDATGKALHTAGAANTFYPTVSIVIEAGKVYKVVFTLSSYSAGEITMTLGGVLGTVRSENGTFTSNIKAVTTGNLIFTPTTTFGGMLDNISIVEITEGALSVEGANTFAGRTILESGSATYPAMVFSDDASAVGWFRYGKTSMGYATDALTRQVFTPSTHWINSDAATISMGTTVPDAWFRRNGADSFAFGNVDAAAPAAQTISVQNVVAGTTDTAGVDFTISGSQGTGTGAGGDIVFKTAPAAAGTGNTQNALQPALTIGSAGLTAQGVTDASLAIVMEADQGADNPDTWQILITDGDEWALQAYAGGSYADALTVVGSTLAADFPGALTVGSMVSDAEISGVDADFSGDLYLDATKKVILADDADDHTYLLESGADVFDLYVGGVNAIKVTESTTISGVLTDNWNVSGAITEAGNAVYNSSETPGGELGGTWASPTIDDSVAVTSWNLTTPTFTTSATVTDAFTLWLGSGKATIQFDDETTDYVSFSNCNVGIGTTVPDFPLHVQVTNPTYTDIETVFGGGISEGGKEVGIALSTAGDALGGYVSSNLVWSDNIASQENTGRASGFIRFSNLASAGKTSEITLGGTVPGSTTLVERVFIDENGSVGIGTANPSDLLEVSGPAGSPAVLNLNTEELTIVDGDKLGQIDFAAPLESSFGDANTVGASIWAEAEETFDATNNGTALVFATGDSEVATARMRINKTGAVGIGLEPTANMAGLSIEDGLLTLKERATPTADANYGKVYTKNDNELYFQDGAGNEHKISVTEVDYAGMYWNANGNPSVLETANTPILIRQCTTGDVEGWTFDAGSTGAISAYVDYSGTVAGTVKATCTAAHNLTTGDEVSIRGTTNYNGVFTITVVDADEFYFTDTWVADDGASDWDEGSNLVCGTGSAGRYLVNWSVSVTEAGGAGSNVIFQVYVNATSCGKCVGKRKFANNDYGSISSHSIRSFVEGDKLYFAATSDGANNITVQYGNVTLNRI